MTHHAAGLEGHGRTVIDELVTLRRKLHSQPELAGAEHQTAATLRTFLQGCGPDALLEGLGGQGLAAVFTGRGPGPRLLLRAELDALPIPEPAGLAHASQRPGVAHKCGHDGHMAILAGLGRTLSRKRPRRGEVVLLFQPAEETGAGAQAVLADAGFDRIRPDQAFALHNLPGFAAGRVVLRPGTFAAASRGLALDLRGATAHAAEPQRGISPALAIAALIDQLSAAGQFHTALHEAAQVTVVHAVLGSQALGTSPGHGRLVATLRAHRTEVVERLAAHCRALAEATARAHRLELSLDWLEPFPATVNDPQAVAQASEAAAAAGLQVETAPRPFPWSEDFGHFTAACPGALIGLGAGEQQPALHHPDYDFPDELIEPGRALLAALVDRLLDEPGPG